MVRDHILEPRAQWQSHISLLVGTELSFDWFLLHPNPREHSCFQRSQVVLGPEVAPPHFGGQPGC